uniref:Uncharacterized protein n=1 Tax=Rhizophora mucronata TaxID=61149 RepID=A0A2P2NQK2_RHIMU
MVGPFKVIKSALPITITFPNSRITSSDFTYLASSVLSVSVASKSRCSR